MADVRLAQVDEHPFGISWVIDEPGARASHALKVDGRVYIIDPVEHAAALERIEVLGPVAAVVQLLDRHNRDCAAIAAKLGVPHLRMPEAIPNTPLQAIRVVDLRRWREVALWWPRRDVLVVPEALGTSSIWTAGHGVVGLHPILRPLPPKADRKSTRLNSSHMSISYAVFCLKKKKARRHQMIAATH